jgi:hypothetical protein
VSTDPSPTLESDKRVKIVQSGEVNIGESYIGCGNVNDTEVSIQSSSHKVETKATEDIKIEVEDMLEHSSGAAVYEKLLCSGGFTSVVDDDEEYGDKVSGEETLRRGAGMEAGVSNNLAAGFTSGESAHDVDSEPKPSPTNSAESLKAAEAAKAAAAMREMKELLARKYKKTLDDKER